MKSRTSDNLLGLLVIFLILAVSVAIAYVYLLNIDSIPTGVQVVVVMVLIVITMEGIGLSSVGRYAGLDVGKLLYYVPFLRTYMICEIVGETDASDVWEKIKLPFYTIVLTLICIGFNYFIPDKSLKSLSMVAIYMLMALFIITRSIYLYFIFKALYDNTLISAIFAFPLFQLITIWLLSDKVKKLELYESYEQ